MVRHNKQPLGITDRSIDKVVFKMLLQHNSFKLSLNSGDYQLPLLPLRMS